MPSFPLRPLRPLVAVALIASALAAGPLPARAGEGHDHGDAPAAAARALPRFAAASELFDLVGVLNGTRLTLYLDRAQDNAPISYATIEVELGGAKHRAEPGGDGTFRITLPAAPKPGVLPVTASVEAEGEADLLAGELDLHEDGTTAQAHRHRWPWLAGSAIAALLLAAGIASMLRKLRRSA